VRKGNWLEGVLHTAACAPYKRRGSPHDRGREATTQWLRLGTGEGSSHNPEEKGWIGRGSPHNRLCPIQAEGITTRPRYGGSYHTIGCDWHRRRGFATQPGGKGKEEGG